mmetsp:Transcript_27524/g.40496  ORF Transcript_27524/g.40496 Transcript_27524/m.40496 type:complete len:1131 (-) Transcript_27524:848-4240(-)
MAQNRRSNKTKILLIHKKTEKKRKRGKSKSNDPGLSQPHTDDSTNSIDVDQTCKRNQKEDTKERNGATTFLRTETEKAGASRACGETKDEERYLVSHKEMDGCFSMKVSDYIRYLDTRHAALERIALLRLEADRDPVDPDDEQDDTFGRHVDKALDGIDKLETDVKNNELFIYDDVNGETKSVNVVDVVLYMIDYDMVKLLPPLYEDFINKFKMPGCLPGGIHCMMNSVNAGGRPFMGPNIYLTPPGSFTHFHQDGHGTVDSGHQCLSGYNEVVMLRRLTERHKQHALQLLRGEGNGQTLSNMQYDALYGLPHEDGCGERPMWPDCESIERCRKMNYYPSVFILKPGQHVHINKGRLHAFRKLSPTSLPQTDCHAKLRKSIILDENLGFGEQLCMSVAWDWMFKGVTSEGTNREVASILECARLNRKHMKQSLAIPETSLLHMARNLITDIEGVKRPRLLAFGKNKKKRRKSSSSDVAKPPYEPDPLATLLGIFPSLEYVITRHVDALVEAERKKVIASNLQRVSIGKRPNSWENPDMFSLDPYGNGDFFCKLCSEELSNVYMHCDGCEKILNKDFNICIGCHSEGRYKVKVQMHPLNSKRHSTINHTGDFERMFRKRCPCKNGPACLNCSFCSGCSCKCHRWFTLHCRFFNISDEKILLDRAKAVIPELLPPFVHETRARLSSFKCSFEKVGDASNIDSSTASENQEPDNDPTEPNLLLDTCVPCKVKENQIEKSSNSLIPEPKRQRTTRSTIDKIPESHTGFPGADEEMQIDKNSNDMIRESKRERRTRGTIYKIPESQEPESLDVTHKPKRRKNNRKTITRKKEEKMKQSEAETHCVGKDWDRRCSTLVVDVPLAQCPTSKFDLSAAAIAYTAPKGTLSDPVTRGGRIDGGFDVESFQKFLHEARSLKDPTAEALRSLLPFNVNLQDDHIRHLFRNFADTKVVQTKKGTRGTSVYLSRRETDIVSYFVAHDLRISGCRLLIPYRPNGTIGDMLKEVENNKKYHLSQEYMKQVNKSVEIILELEGYLTEISDPETPSFPSREKQNTCSKKKQSGLIADGNGIQKTVWDEQGREQHQSTKEDDRSTDFTKNFNLEVNKCGSPSSKLSQEERKLLRQNDTLQNLHNEVHL